MSASAKLGSSHLRRQAFVDVRQSTQAQTERNTESTERQYALVARALANRPGNPRRCPRPPRL
jgi:hypothetical protein